jgi:hypothetical protein
VPGWAWTCANRHNVEIKRKIVLHMGKSELVEIKCLH